MVTVFHVVQLMTAFAGGGVGIAAGQRFGITGAILGGLSGLLIGAALGHMPFLVAWFFTRPQRHSTDELRRLVRGPAWPYAHLALAELVRRGESIDEERCVAREMLLSDDSIKRRHGHAILLGFYPDLASILGEYDPHDFSSETRERVVALPWLETTVPHPPAAPGGAGLNVPLDPLV